jgi:hypothetical protein
VKPTIEGVYALSGWSIKVDGTGFRIGQTAYYEAKSSWSKSYATLQGATSAIARKLAEEFNERHSRRVAFHKKKKAA